MKAHDLDADEVSPSKPDVSLCSRQQRSSETFGNSMFRRFDLDMLFVTTGTKSAQHPAAESAI